MNLIALVLQQTTPVARSILPQIIMIGSFIAIFYFLLLRPQRKMQQEHRAMLDALKKGDEVMTEGGIIGQVVHLTDDRVTIRSAENTRLVIARSKINRIMTTETPAESK